MKEIIEFIRKNKCLTAILIISLGCIVKFSELPLIPMLPKSISYIIQKPNVNTMEYEIFGLLENLSLAYFASFIFYIIIDYIPNQKMANKSFEIIKEKLILLYSYMSRIISPLNIVLNLEKGINSIEITDVQKLDNFKLKNERVYFNTIAKINESESTKLKEYFNYYTDTPKYADLIKKTINEIKNMPCAVYVDFEILEILSSIELNRFLNQVLFFENETLSESNNTIRINFGNSYFDFIQSYLKLNKFNFNKHSYHQELMDDVDKKKYLEFLNKSK